MNRKILIQVAAPAVLIGLLLFSACLISVWQINRVQTKMAQILAQNVASLRAAEKLEINLRRLRFHCFLYLIDPRPETLDRIHADHLRIEKWLGDAGESAQSPDGRASVETINAGYMRYREDFDRLSAQVRHDGPIRDFKKLETGNPVQYVIDPCRDLMEISEKQMERTSEDANTLSGQVRVVMLVLGFLGPLSGVIIGYGVARGLSRSIYQLSVRVQNVAQRLDQDVASVRLAADGDIQNLDRQLQVIVSRVEEVAERLQRQQRELLRAEQLSAVGQLAAGVAHEVRNPLAAIKLLVEAALRKRNPMPLTEEDLEVIHREVGRLEHTVQGFLDFARLPTPRRSVIDLRQVVTQAIGLVAPRARQQRIEVKAESPAEPVRADVDANQMSTVVVNLLLNALDAMPQGGRVKVELETAGEKGIQLRVSDTGTGISPEMAERLFTPFSSTKPTGTGLGLSLSRRIVEEHGGTISAENRVEGGACFVIALPEPGAVTSPGPTVVARGERGD